MGIRDAGYAYHVVLYSNDGSADPAVWRRQHKVVILINNGIHPGEPDGVDASMLLLRDLVAGKAKLPDNVALAVIPLYNNGGGRAPGAPPPARTHGPPNPRAPAEPPKAGTTPRLFQRRDPGRPEIGQQRPV